MYRKDQFLSAALKAADEGFRVFPVEEGGKRPARFVEHWKDWATTDTRVIERTWYRTRLNVGIHCGPAEIVVLDYDVKDGLCGDMKLTAWLLDNKLIASADEDYQTKTNLSPSGGGHLYFRRPRDLIVGNSRGSLPEGIDVRGVGGYVLAAGSRIGGKWYCPKPGTPTTIAPMPDQLVDALSRPVRSTVVPLRPPRSGMARDYFEEACTEVMALRPGSRHTGLLRVANRVGHLMADGAIRYHRSVVESELLDAVLRQLEPDDLRSAEITIRDGLDNALRTHVYRPMRAVPDLPAAEAGLSL